MARGDVPAIKWGTAFANTLNIGYPLDDSITFSKPRPGSEVFEGRGGVDEAWIVAHNQFLRGAVRWIPVANTTSPVIATGWDGATGFRAFLEWARARNQIRFIPDKDTPGTYVDCYLIEPWEEEPGLEAADRSRTLTLLIRTVNGSAFAGY